MHIQTHDCQFETSPTISDFHWKTQNVSGHRHKMSQEKIVTAYPSLNIKAKEKLEPNARERMREIFLWEKILFKVYI